MKPEAVVTSSRTTGNITIPWQSTWPILGKVIGWEGKSDQGMKCYGRDRGVLILGTEGSVIIDHEGYEVYDWNRTTDQEGRSDEINAGGPMAANDHRSQDQVTDAHFRNLINGMQTDQRLHSPVAEINITIASLQLANISWMVNGELSLDPKTGHVMNTFEAMKLWSGHRKGWEVTV